jgi:hypothetical protein
MRMYLPPTPPHLWRPWVKGSIAAFEAAYTRRIITLVLSKMEKDTQSPTLKEFWKGYNILYADTWLCNSCEMGKL